MTQYSTALSHVALVGVGLYCLKQVINYNIQFAEISFSVIVMNSLLGTWRWGNPSYGYKITKLYGIVSKLQDLLVYPCIVTTLWLKYNYPFQIASAHTAVAFLPLLAYLYDNRRNEVEDTFIGANILSLIYVCYFNDNYYGMATAFSYFISYFCIKREMIINIPVEESMSTLYLFNYSMCFFACFALKATFEPIF